ncbi:regulator of protease activity HflC (stomatin/prohibitin superfamily) [Thermosporothrix hazakensis]|jgi:regulator of protease activity HflC (stomatin/prohibitin superfamily)|uniref:Regulator of protease activity HflC (Stomatin/prohibitin superfamily) n=1 Tax=Thermosporothrix hazakensis TaxID=644383 RepID=A0A326TXF9_THEHA|nr:slipin family protein [Thermosporothrix hazakensis]PZW21060.1 regulator of protease activity HflC (stomatin/prohibitin superfamily) [Thermosporothrix hazakensis]GCE46381.1 membrane protein [Thermosporothrix hazakensis]
MDILGALSLIVIVAIVLLFVLFSGLRVVQEYERGVIFVLGKLEGAKGPGLFWVWPFISRMIKVDLRVVTINVPPQEIITRDNVTVKVTAVIYFHVVNPEWAVTRVFNFVQATTQIGQTTLRNVLGQSELDELLAHRNKINQELQAIIDERTEAWGVKVTAVEIKDIELPSTMQRAMAKQAEAEREKRAKIIHAEGELQASTQLAQAAGIIGSEPNAMQLRYLQTLTEISVEKNSTIIFPLPMELVTPLMKTLNKLSGASEQSQPEEPVYALRPQQTPTVKQAPPVQQTRPVSPTQQATQPHPAIQPRQVPPSPRQ